jgi:hypothetical protein
MADNRLNRELETRAKTERRKSWSPPETLPSPNQAEGYGYRWIRLSTQGEADATNVSAKLREGWEPVLAKDHPEIFLSVVENNRFKDNIVIGGLMLCRAPLELIKERDDYYQEQAKAQMTTVDNNLMRESDPRMPVFNDRRTTVTFGKG